MVCIIYFQAGGESTVTAPPQEQPPSEPAPLIPSPWQQQKAPVPWQQERRGGGGQWGQRSSRWDQSTFPSSHPDEPPPPPPAHKPHYENRGFDRGACMVALGQLSLLIIIINYGASTRYHLIMEYQYYHPVFQI